MESMKDVLEALKPLCAVQMEGWNTAMLVSRPFNAQPLQLDY